MMKDTSSRRPIVKGDPQSISRVSFEGTSARLARRDAMATDMTIRTDEEIPRFRFFRLPRKRTRDTIDILATIYTGSVGSENTREIAPPSMRPCISV